MGRWLWFSTRCLIILVGLFAATAGAMRWRYGGGEPYPDLTAAPLLPSHALELVVATDIPLGNAAVSADRRIFFTEHPEAGPPGAKLYEWRQEEAVPYPNAQDQAALFDTPLGLVVDRQNRLWVIDAGNHGAGVPQLSAFDLATGSRVHHHLFSSAIAPLGSFLQDLQISPDGQTVYIADVSFWRKTPGLVVYDVATKTARRRLTGHPSVTPQDYIITNPIKQMTFFNGLIAMKPGVDGLALEPSGTWLYYAAMSHDTIFRIRTDDLTDAALSDKDLVTRVQPMGKKPLADGLSSDRDGNIYITDVEHGAVLRLSPAGDLTTLIKDTRIRWADALSFGPDGWLYLTDSAIPHLALRSRGHIESQRPFAIFRFKPGTAGIPGQ